MIALLLTSLIAYAQIQNEPTEVVTAAPAPVFSERAGVWPSDTLDSSIFGNNDRTTMNDRWNTVPGVQSREQGSPTLSVRGSAQSDRVLQLFDGAPLNMADGVGAATLLIPTEVMSNVSLIKGPSSVFYGNSAMAGAIDHRLRYFDETTLSAQIADAGGEFGDRRGSLVIPFTRNRKPIAQVSLLSERDPGAFLYQSSLGSGRREHNSQDLLRATAATDFEFGSGWRLSGRIVEAHSSGESPGSLVFPLTSAFDQKGSLATVQLSHALGVSTLASLRITDTRLWGDYDHGASSSFVSRTSLFADFNTGVSDSLLIRTFGDLSYDSLTASYVGSAQFYQNDADVGQTYQWSLSPELSLQPSYRYQSRYGQLFKALAAVFTKGRSTTSLSYGEGFRAPSLTDRFGNFSTFIANPSLQPERSWSVELESEFLSGKRYGSFLEGFAVKASTYYTGFTDLVDTKTIGASVTKINAGNARSVGAEASFAYGYKIWMLSAAYSYLDGRNLTAGEPLRLAPRHQAAVSIAQLFGPLLFEAKETIWSSFYDRDPLTGSLVELPAWTTFDLSVRTLALTDWEFRLGASNLFDKSRSFTYGYPEAQRRFYLGASRFF
jgi:outer membrane receptor protein involved in Fe transport